MTAGERIGAARKAAGLTQKELAEKIGVSAATLGKWETGYRNPKISTVRRIAAALDLDPLQLLDGMSGPVLEAVWAKCRDCCGGQDAEVMSCPVQNCPLWRFRLGAGGERPSGRPPKRVKVRVRARRSNVDRAAQRTREGG